MVHLVVGWEMGVNRTHRTHGDVVCGLEGVVAVRRAAKNKKGHVLNV